MPDYISRQMVPDDVGSDIPIPERQNVESSIAIIFESDPCSVQCANMTLSGVWREVGLCWQLACSVGCQALDLLACFCLRLACGPWAQEGRWMPALTADLVTLCKGWVAGASEM